MCSSFFSRTFFWLSCILVFIFTTMTLGCSKFLETQKKDEDTIELTDPRLNCLKDFPARISQFAEGDLSTEGLDSSIQCVDDAIDVFKKRYRGTQNKSYTRQDLTTFFNKYFFQNNPLPTAFAHSLLQLKTAFFGGTDQILTHQEMDQIIKWFQQIKTPLVDIAQDLPYYMFQKRVEFSSLSAEEHEKKILKLKTFVEKVLQSTLLSTSNYQIEDFEQLVKELLQFMNSSASQQVLAKVKRFFPLVPALKKVLIAPQGTSSQQDFSETVDTYIELLGSALKAFHQKLFEERLFNDLRSADRLLDFSIQIVSILENSPVMKRNGKFELDAFNVFIDAVVSSKILSDQFKADSTKKAVQQVFQKLFDSQHRFAGKEITFIDQQHFAELTRELFMIKAGVVLLSRGLSSSLLSINDFPVILSDEKIRQVVDEFFGMAQFARALNGSRSSDEIEEKTRIVRDLSRLRQVMSTGHPIKFDQQMGLLLDGQHTNIIYTSEALAQIVLIKGFTRLLTQGYGEPQNQPIHLRGILKEGLNQWYSDFKDFGVDLQVFDPRTKDMNSRFVEANFFTFAGNGDERMQYQETFEYLHFLFSAGISSAELLRRELLIAGCQRLDKEGKTEIDPFGKMKLKRDCVKEVWKTKFPSIFPNLPGMVALVSNLAKSDSEFDQFFNIFEKAAFGHQPVIYDTGELRTVVAMTHYVESIYTLFDLDRDSFLSLAEIRRSSPRFLPLIAKKTGFSPTGCSAQVAYEYLVVLGKVPGLLDVGWNVHLCRDPDENAKASRLQIFQVLMELRSSLQ